MKIGDKTISCEFTISQALYQTCWYAFNSTYVSVEKFLKTMDEAGLNPEPLEEVREIIKYCRSNGVKTVLFSRGKQ